MNRYSYILLFIIAIALFAQSPLEAKENYSESPTENFFVCTTETLVPILYMYTSGKTSLTPLISWHPEYLLTEDSANQTCEQVAKKLQYLYQQPGQKYISTEKKEEYTSVCMVMVENETCSSHYSELLFKINPNYNAKCVLNHREPLECITVGRSRGVFSIPDSPYKPIWWLW